MKSKPKEPMLKKFPDVNEHIADKTSIPFAQALKAAVKIHNACWDEEKGKCSKDLAECVYESFKEKGLESIWYAGYLLLQSDWNDILDWAEHILED